MPTTNANELPDRDEAARLRQEAAAAEAIARRDESLANVRRGRQFRDRRGPDAYAQVADEAEEQAANSRREADELASQSPVADPEGTAPTLADRAGNYAPNREVANAGGTGIDGSNTNMSSGEQATTADEVGVETASAAPSMPIGRGGIVERRSDDDNGNGERRQRGRPKGSGKADKSDRAEPKPE